MVGHGCEQRALSKKRESPVAIAIRNALLPPAAMPIDGESMQFLGMAFDRKQIHKLASELAGEPMEPALAGFARR